MTDQGDIILQGFGCKMGTNIFSKWDKKYFMLYPNRIEWGDSIQVHMHTCAHRSRARFSLALATLTQGDKYPGSRVRMYLRAGVLVSFSPSLGFRKQHQEC